MEEINGKIEAAIKALENKQLKVAKTTMEEGKTFIHKQQKLIRITDREENGWEVVEHYLSDDLASDSEEEKAIAKARKEALASIAKKKEQFRNVSLDAHKSRMRGGQSWEYGDQ